jgi:hypothetical protein
MITKDDLERAYPKYVTEIKSTVEEFNDRIDSFVIDLKIRVEKIKDFRYPANDKNSLLLGIGDLVEKVEKSDYYSLFVDYVKEKGHHIHTQPFSFKDDFSKLVIIEHYIHRYGENNYSAIFSFYTKKESESGATITLLEGTKDEKGLKVRLPDFSEIMSSVLIED